MNWNYNNNSVTIVDCADFRAEVKLPTLDGPTDGEIKIPSSDIQCDHPSKKNLQCHGRFCINDEMWYLRIDSAEDDFEAFWVEVTGIETLPPGPPVYDASVLRSASRKSKLVIMHDLIQNSKRKEREMDIKTIAEIRAKHAKRVHEVASRIHLDMQQLIAIDTDMRNESEQHQSQITFDAGVESDFIPSFEAVASMIKQVMDDSDAIRSASGQSSV